MKIQPSTIDRVDILTPDEAGLNGAVAPEALPYTVAVRNRRDQRIAFLGVRFAMLSARAEKLAVVHYADTLRNPSQAELRPGASRAVCAEPSYTAGRPDARGRMNLRNLASMLSIEASLDCVAFEDGRLEGPDSRGALQRLNEALYAEQALLAEIAQAKDPRRLLERAAAETRGAQARVALARKLLACEGDLREAALEHRLRVRLWRA